MSGTTKPLKYAVAMALLVFCATIARADPAQVRVATGDRIAQLQADQQSKRGNVFIADGHVEIDYGEVVLHADHAEFNSDTDDIVARGHVTLDRPNQHIESDSGTYNLKTGRGEFQNVHGAMHVERKPSASVLITPNPLSFEATTADHTDDRTYVLHHAWLTVCTPDRPIWKFYAAEATLHVDQKVVLVNANFRLFRVPLLYLPLATAPASVRNRQSGFLIPTVSNSSIKGFEFGDAYYWAPNDWSDLTAGAELLSKRGWQQNVEFRARPTDDISVSATYFGVIDRGIPSLGVPPEGGHKLNVSLDAHLVHGWHVVTDINTLSSLTFQLVFAPTFGEAVNSEVQTSIFVTNNFDGYSFNVAANDYKDFLSAGLTQNGLVQTFLQQTSVDLRSAPEARFSSVDRAPWRNWPVYVGFDIFAGSASRSQTCQPPTLCAGQEFPTFSTPAMVQRDMFSPRVTVPLHWGPWLGLTSSYAVRVMRYGSQEASDILVGKSLIETTGEATIDLRPPSFERVWGRGNTKWKHTIEPDITYRYVNGVDDFANIIRFDEDDTITDTNELDYSLTQRLYRRVSEGQANDFITWRLEEKYYFDPTFGGALVPGQRNVFAALDSLTPFAFADTPRRYSPVVSDIVISPGGPIDAELRADYDPLQGRFDTTGALLKAHPYKLFNATLAEFTIHNDPLLEPASDVSCPNAVMQTSENELCYVLQPPENQLRMLVGYGDVNRKGWNGSIGYSYDFHLGAVQNELVQISYNGSCCGLAVEYARLSLGTLRDENQLRFALVIANIGTFGNLHRQDKIY
ncbi:MAG: LPS assembly protein LptD [Candidatus Acidiferrales bacterium]